MKEASKIVKATNNSDLNIPLYNDEKVNEEIRHRETQQKMERENKKKAQEKKLRKEERKLLNPISAIDGLLLMTCCLSIVLIAISLAFGNIIYIVYSVIAIFGTIYVGKRLQVNYNKLLNVLLWNITQSIKDFIDYKVPYDLLSNSDFRLFKTSVIFSIICVIVPSNNVIFGIAFVITVIMFIVNFANRLTEDLSKNSKIIAIFCFIGVIVKVILNIILYKTLFIDFTNIVFISLFVSINFYTKNIEIVEPDTENIIND